MNYATLWLAIIYHLTNKQVTGTAYIHIDRGRGASADLSLMKLRAAVSASDALAPAPAPAAVRSASSKDRDAGNASAAAAVGPTVEAAPFQKVGGRASNRRVCVLWASLLFLLG